MTRSTISLDERGYVLAKDQAHALGSFVAEFVRRAIDTSALIASPTAPKAITPSSADCSLNRRSW